MATATGAHVSWRLKAATIGALGTVAELTALQRSAKALAPQHHSSTKGAGSSSHQARGCRRSTRGTQSMNSADATTMALPVATSSALV